MGIRFPAVDNDLSSVRAIARHEETALGSVRGEELNLLTLSQEPPG